MKGKARSRYVLLTVVSMVACLFAGGAVALYVFQKQLGAVGQIVVEAADAKLTLWGSTDALLQLAFDGMMINREYYSTVDIQSLATTADGAFRWTSITISDLTGPAIVAVYMYTEGAWNCYASTGAPYTVTKSLDLALSTGYITFGPGQKLSGKIGNAPGARGIHQLVEGAADGALQIEVHPTETGYGAVSFTLTFGFEQPNG